MNKIEKLLNKYPNIKHATPTKIFDINIYRAYCGKNFKYLEWFCKNYSDISADTELNIHEYTSIGFVGLNRLYDFFNFFEKNSSKLSNKDIYSYSFKELKDALNKISLSASEVKKLNTNIVYEDSDILIVHPASYEAHKLYGANTKWCTTSQESTYDGYNYITYDYNSYNCNFLLILIDKLTNKKSAASINCRVSIDDVLVKKIKVIDAHCIIYDETDYQVFDSTKLPQKHKFNEMLNDDLNKEKTSSYFLIPETLKIASKYCAALILSSSSLKDDKRYYNLITDKFIMRVIKNDNLSNLKTLELFQNMKQNYNIRLDEYYYNLLNYGHDKKCNAVKKAIPSKKGKKNKLMNLHNKLSECSCLKFNKLEFLKHFIDLIMKDSSLKEDYTSIIKILNEKISDINLISKSKKDIINHLMTNDIKNANIIFNNLNLNKNELLFLQVYSGNQSVKDLCFDVTKIPTDFAQEFLKLKNITTIEDLNL